VAAPSWPTGQSFLKPTTTVPVTVANSGIPVTGTYQLPSGTAGANSVYPFSSQYSIYAGHCPAANPATSGATATYVSTSPGANTSASVPLFPLTINVTDSLHKAVTFSLVEQAGSGSTACSSLLTYNLGSTVANQTKYVVGVPLGAFTLSGTDGTNTSTSQPVTVSSLGATATVTL
jgi:hypothetical protein